MSSTCDRRITSCSSQIKLCIGTVPSKLTSSSQLTLSQISIVEEKQIVRRRRRRRRRRNRPANLEELDHDQAADRRSCCRDRRYDFARDHLDLVARGLLNPAEKKQNEPNQ